MSGKLFEGGYGAILNEDIDVLEECLFSAIAESSADHPLRVLEIGMHDGGTARGIEAYCARMGAKLEYVGIDPDEGKLRPRYTPAGAVVIIGDSAEVFSQVTGEFDLVWVDGCHCFNHVVLDTLHYEKKVRDGGFICYHDVNPVGEGAEHQYHGPVIPEFGLAVNQALKALRFPWAPWTFFKESIPLGVHNCGTRAYKKSL